MTFIAHDLKIHVSAAFSVTESCCSLFHTRLYNRNNNNYNDFVHFVHGFNSQLTYKQTKYTQYMYVCVCVFLSFLSTKGLHKVIGEKRRQGNLCAYIKQR